MSSQTEATLAALWRDILSIDSISSDSDFFALGGDSILVMTMLLRVEEEMGVYLDPGIVFDASTLSDFAKKIDQARKASSEATYVTET